ncbi:hypothetical protein [Pandoraea apista]|uniref:Lipoprotein n=1 Tax=Pandoraea apista TaxID=93218 RepID=A0A5E5P268_9BURK|nr:hypothetical protein [Pandoraea apista]VVG70662.1 hypothetical protein PAP18089_01626 [Pandoraea apista]
MNAPARLALTVVLIVAALAFMACREITSWYACRAAHDTTYCLFTWEN